MCPTAMGVCYNLEFLSSVPIVQRPRTWPFQGQNTGSNPVGDESPRDNTRSNNPDNDASPVSVHMCACALVGVNVTRPRSNDDTIGRA
jgi:hypothetical protein